jgi:hypothetical protein
MVAVDATVVRAHQHAAGAWRQPPADVDPALLAPRSSRPGRRRPPGASRDHPGPAGPVVASLRRGHDRLRRPATRQLPHYGSGVRLRHAAPRRAPRACLSSLFPGSCLPRPTLPTTRTAAGSTATSTPHQVLADRPDAARADHPFRHGFAPGPIKIATGVARACRESAAALHLTARQLSRK